jgi:hypothetical protein
MLNFKEHELSGHKVAEGTYCTYTIAEVNNRYYLSSHDSSGYKDRGDWAFEQNAIDHANRAELKAESNDGN